MPLAIPGTADWEGWTVRVEELEPPADPPIGDRGPGAPDQALVDRDALGEDVRVRGWRPGDRIRPLGMQGSKSLQDLFTDRAVPRSGRKALPVVLAGEEVVWVAGVALSDRFRIRPETASALKITATLMGGSGPAGRHPGRGPAADT